MISLQHTNQRLLFKKWSCEKIGHRLQITTSRELNDATSVYTLWRLVKDGRQMTQKDKGAKWTWVKEIRPESDHIFLRLWKCSGSF